MAALRAQSIRRHPLLHLTFQEHAYLVCAVKLLAPAILLRSLMSVAPVFHEDGPGEVGQQRSMLEWG